MPPPRAADLIGSMSRFSNAGSRPIWLLATRFVPEQRRILGAVSGLHHRALLDNDGPGTRQHGQPRALESKEYFRWEYPLTTCHRLIAVAFTHSRRSGPPDQQGKHRNDGRLVLGVGRAGMGADRALILVRRDYRSTHIATRYSLDAMDAAKRVGQMIRQE